MAFQSKELTPDRSARHLYGAEVRRLREKAEMSLVRLGEVLKYSKSQLARIEAAESVPPPGLSEALDAAFGTDGHFARLYPLARREAHPRRYRRYMDFEAVARVVEHWAAHVVPGLLQTEAYARELLRCHAEVTEEEVEQRVAARLGRQERLRGDAPPRVWAVLDEGVIRRLVGGSEVMREQLSALLALVDTPRTKVQVLPFRHGGHSLLGGSLTLLRLQGSMSVAYEEGIEASCLYEDAAEVERRQADYDALRAYALSPRESAALIRSAMEDCKPCEQPPT
ncbi:Scr1 family TA system antitoxin-like transcriptional regulator [Streptomyces sp. NPDC018031]|uniref:helix-turn-helix domain-containing protein n=1 Tax=Streptomyces sp. NPDC018031 TaxID=3365033 RepID=UPI0037A1936F